MSNTYHYIHGSPPKYGPPVPYRMFLEHLGSRYPSGSTNQTKEQWQFDQILDRAALFGATGGTITKSQFAAFCGCSTRTISRRFPALRWTRPVALWEICGRIIDQSNL